MLQECFIHSAWLVVVFVVVVVLILLPSSFLIFESNLHFHFWARTQMKIIDFVKQNTNAIVRRNDVELVLHSFEV